MLVDKIHEININKMMKKNRKKSLSIKIIAKNLFLHFQVQLRKFRVCQSSAVCLLAFKQVATMKLSFQKLFRSATKGSSLSRGGS